MAKTFEALKRSEKETGNTTWAAPETRVPQREKTPPPITEDGWEPEIPPLKVKQGGLSYTPEPASEYPPPGTPPIAARMMKFKGISATVEEYRKMEHKIFNYESDKPIKAILFCSSHRGEGNSTVCLNFAQTLATQGHRVLLVDADLRNPTLHRMFQFEQGKGLTDLCLGKTSLENAMKITMLDNLWVITSGMPYSNPSAIFESEVFDALLDQMKIHADCILFDSPPLDSYDDSIALAAKVDGVVLVLQSEKTRREVAHKSKQRLENTGARILGVVLNQRKYHIPNWLYRRL